MGTDGVGWQNNTDSGPFLYRTVDASQFVSVRLKISAMTPEGWNEAGSVVRRLQAVPAPTGTENWQTALIMRDNYPETDYRDMGEFWFQSRNATNGAGQEFTNSELTMSDVNFVRLDHLGGGVFQAYRGSGPDSDINWIPMQDVAMMPLTQTNLSLASGPIQVGIVAGDSVLATAGGHVLIDWAEIHTTTLTYRDDFEYTRDFSTQGVVGFSPRATSGGEIWNGIENANAGGLPTRSGNIPEPARLAILSIAALWLAAFWRSSQGRSTGALRVLPKDWEMQGRKRLYF
jgi:hypothetical protein